MVGQAIGSVLHEISDFSNLVACLVSNQIHFSKCTDLSYLTLKLSYLL